MHIYSTSRINKPKALILSSVVALVFGIASYSLSVGAMEDTYLLTAGHKQTYIANLDPLNNSSLDGTAEFVLIGNKLKVTVNATGLEPGVHPQHIHGQELAAAECPTDEADTNNDGFISVLEGAPAYGPIKLNLTSPQTTFGAPPTLALFTEFAGTADNNNFPVTGEDGKLYFVQKYSFDNSEVAQAAFRSITPLGDQHFVLHGGTAPLGVDADAFAALGAPRPEGYNTEELSYDVLLPVGCGEINETKSKNVNSTVKAEKLNSQLSDAKVKLDDNLSKATQNLSGSSSSVIVQTATNDFTNVASQLTSNFDMKTADAISMYNSNISNGMNKDEARNQLINIVANARDHEVNKLYEARNQLIDQLNRHGSVAERDHFLNTFDKAIEHYNSALEQAKNML